MEKYYKEIKLYTKKNKRNVDLNPLLNKNINFIKINDIDYLLNTNVTVSDLKNILKKLKLTINGNKTEIIFKLYNILKLTLHVKKIQKLWKHYLLKNINNLQGPAKFNRKICNNIEDFYTMEKIHEINPLYFYSFKDSDNFVYGFNLQSIKQMIDKKQLFNPYNKNKFTKQILSDIYKRIQYNKFLNYNIDKCIEKNKNDIIVNNENLIRNKTLSLFLYIDEFGYYTDINWFLNLTRRLVIRFIRELYDIWNYRANLTNINKFDFCPWCNGNPFSFINLSFLNNRNISDDTIKLMALTVIEKFLNPSTDINVGNKSIICMYILSSLTLVSNDAAQSLPWLFDSVL